MLIKEKEKILAFFTDPQRWCRNAEARDETGEAVRYDHPSAVAWDMTGLMCLLFGWRRARELFCQLDRHIHGARRVEWPWADTAITSMVALQERNDENDTTFDMVIKWLQTMPVWCRSQKS